MRFTPHITVASVITDQERFLLVEEHDGGRIVFNQPAGHLEASESLIQAAHRETLEETGWEVTIEAVLGVYLYTSTGNQVTYQRICFIGTPVRHHPHRALDQGIIAAHWLTYAQIKTKTHQLRSPLVLHCIEDYLQGHRFSLDLIRT